MKADIRGCSTCQPGQEHHEAFTAAGRQYVQYDYRTPAGQLFSCIAPDLARARQRRDTWLADQVDPYNRIPERAWPRLHAAVDRLRSTDDRQTAGSEVI